MCDEHTEKENEAFLTDRAGLSRRRFSALTAGSVAAGYAAPALAADIVETDLEIATPDGTADCHFAHPATGKHAAVLVWPDIMGLRPAFRAMGKRLASSGYAVLTVNPFYRQTKAPVLKEGEGFGSPGVREKLMPLARSLTPEITETDAKAFTAWLDAQAAVDTGRKIGTTGYCMGGPLTFRTAATLPDRIGAVGSFHGGGLVTDQPTSPHLLLPKAKASFLVAIAQNDDQRDPNAKDVLREAFDKAGLEAEIEVYPAQHGWCAIDTPVYDETQAEKAWSRKLALFGTALA